MKLKEKVEKADIWCLADSPKGRIGRVSNGMPRGAQVVIKDAVSERNLIDEQGKKQGRSENYIFAMQHRDNGPDEEGWAKEIGTYEGRQLMTWLESVSTYKDSVKHGPEIHYNQEGEILSIENYENGKVISTIFYDSDNRVESFRHNDENEQPDGLQIYYGHRISDCRFEKPRYELCKNGDTMASGDLLELKEDPVKYSKRGKELDSEERSASLKKLLKAFQMKGKKRL